MRFKVTGPQKPTFVQDTRQTVPSFIYIKQEIYTHVFYGHRILTKYLNLSELGFLNIHPVSLFMHTNPFKTIFLQHFKMAKKRRAWGKS